MHACIVKVENEWRDEYCPDYGNAYCDCYTDVVICPGAWECDDIDTVVLDVMAYYDTDVNGAINPADAIDDEHYGIIVDNCDMNNDGNISACELHSCVLDVENAWRDENCPGYGYLWCDCIVPEPECEGEWNCVDILYMTEEFMNEYDTNMDGNVNLGDNIDNEHFSLLVDNCDTNGDGTLTAHEIYECAVACENIWRAEYCGEDYP
jgi:Ca2+-binding EF-hand superfamily protein